MRLFAALALCLTIVGCAAEQPESARTVAAYEVPLASENEGRELISMLRRVASVENMHVDAATPEQLREMAAASPAFQMTIHAAVWRGPGDEEHVATIMDQHDHLGQVWIMFSRGEDPAANRRFRDAAMLQVQTRWPGTLSLPVLPTGAIPNHDDLVQTPRGYVVNPAAVARYAEDGQ